MKSNFVYLLQNAPVLEISDAGHFACHSQIPNVTDSAVYLRPLFFIKLPNVQVLRARYMRVQ